MPINIKLYRVVTYYERLPTYSHSTLWSRYQYVVCGNLKNLYLYFHNTDGRKTLQGADFREELQQRNV